tara:strand:- start:1270 stop:1500 length:231 start_codon:yes stop_codon:yes gene_type:complete
MGKVKATLPDYPTVEFIYDEPMPECKDEAWALETAVHVCGSIQGEQTNAYFARLKRYAKHILKTLNEIRNDSSNLD